MKCVIFVWIVTIITMIALLQFKRAPDQFIKAYFIEYTCMSWCSVNNDFSEWFCELISHHKLECHYLLMCVLQTSWSSAQFKYFTKFIVISHRHWGFHNVYVISTTIWQRSIAFCCCKYPKSILTAVRCDAKVMLFGRLCQRKVIFYSRNKMPFKTKRSLHKDS